MYFLLEPIPYNTEPIVYIIPPSNKYNSPIFPIEKIILLIPNSIDHPFNKWQITSKTWNLSIFIHVKVIPTNVIKLTKENNNQPIFPPTAIKEIGI